MKKLKSIISVLVFILLFIPVSIKATNGTDRVAPDSPKNSITTDEEMQFSRLEEIKAMDLSRLSQSEKKELREEVLAIQNSQYVRSRHGGYYGRGYYGHNVGRMHHGFFSGTADYPYFISFIVITSEKVDEKVITVIISRNI